MMVSWKKVQLGQICSFKYGQMPNKADLRDVGYPVFSGYGIVGASTKFHYETPQIIVVARGVGGTGDVKMSPPFCFLTNLSIAVLPNDPEVDKAFLYYRLAGPKLWDLRTGSAQAQITIERLRIYEIELPPLTVQRRIASILGAYDDLIDLNRRRIALLEEMARQLFEEWFVRLRYPGHEDALRGRPVPLFAAEGWVNKAIRELGKVVTGKTPSKARPDYFGGNVPFIKIPDMHGCNFVLSTSDHLSSGGAASQSGKMIPPGSLCVSCIGTIGLVAITTEPCQTNQQINSIILHHEHSREFLFFEGSEDSAPEPWLDWRDNG